LEALFHRGDQSFPAYLKFCQQYSHMRAWADELVAFTRPWIDKVGLSRVLLKRFAPETVLYFERPSIRHLLLQRVCDVLNPLISKKERILLIGHSMGAILAVDALSKLREQIQAPMQVQLLTLGSPIADPYIERALNQDKRAHHLPVSRWDNLAAHDDFVAYEKKLDQLQRSWVAPEVLLSNALVCNFFRHPKYGLNSHKSYGYLDSPITAQIIADFLNID
jgi:pimeloyl-ACP methyl ester carboxylesterase